jgi:hypothetical protein
MANPTEIFRQAPSLREVKAASRAAGGSAAGAVLQSLKGSGASVRPTVQIAAWLSGLEVLLKALQHLTQGAR